MKLELLMRKVCRKLYDEQIAFVFKVPEEMQQTPCDFFGHTTTGRAIMIECKQVKRSSLPTHQMRSNGLQPHQYLALLQASKCNVHSFVIWQNGEHIAVMTFHQFDYLSIGRKSLAWSEASNLVVDDLFDYFKRALR